MRTPDRHGALEEVTLNRDTVDGLLNKNAYYGSTVGRVANRIANAEFALEGQVCVHAWGKALKSPRFLARTPTIGSGRSLLARGGQVYKLAANNGPNHLHGGLEGFDRKVWDAEPVTTADAVGVRFRLQSPDGEEGYPGNLSVEVCGVCGVQDHVSYCCLRCLERI